MVCGSIWDRYTGIDPNDHNETCRVCAGQQATVYRVYSPPVATHIDKYIQEDLYSFIVYGCSKQYETFGRIYKKNMKIALIGASGQLGTDIHKIFRGDKSYHIIPLTHEDIDITSKNSTKILSTIRPDMIINLAAYHRVDACENNWKKTLDVNAFAVKQLSKYCAKTNATLVQFSSDYVFGAQTKRTTPYKETDSAGPINVYGMSRYLGEYVVQKSLKKFFLIRTSGLFGSAKSNMKAGGNFVELMITKAHSGKQFWVVNDQTSIPTYSEDLARNLKTLLKTKNYGLFHIASKGSCTWYEFAVEIFRLLKLDTQITPCNSNFWQTPAKRPQYSVLDCAKLDALGLYTMPTWRQGLKKYLQETGRIA